MSLTEPRNKKVFCRECNELKDLPASTGEAMIAMTLQYCGSCYFWHQLEVLKDDPNSVRIGGKHYFIGQETSLEQDPPKWRGMGGGKVIVEFFDGHRVTSTNFWYQGEIPEKWQKRIPENARFINQKGGSE